MRPNRFLRAFAALALWTVFARPCPAAPDPLHEYLEKNRCPVADRLSRLYDAGDPANDHGRFIVVSLLADKEGYVQCLFHDNEHRLFCEASSGFYEAKPGAPRTVHLPAQRIAALGRLGFSTDDTKGNFSRDAAVPTPPDFAAIADFILIALHDGYGARVDTPLRFYAPFAPGLTLACDPVG